MTKWHGIFFRHHGREWCFWRTSLRFLCLLPHRLPLPLGPDHLIPLPQLHHLFRLPLSVSLIFIKDFSILFFLHQSHHLINQCYWSLGSVCHHSWIYKFFLRHWVLSAILFVNFQAHLPLHIYHQYSFCNIYIIIIITYYSISSITFFMELSLWVIYCSCHCNLVCRLIRIICQSWWYCLCIFLFHCACKKNVTSDYWCLSITLYGPTSS